MPQESTALARRLDLRAAIVAAVVVGLLLRVWEAASSSLWLDELHTLAHASLPTLREVVDSVAREYHSPLFFVGVHLFGGWEEGAWLRAIPVLSSLLVFVPLAGLARSSQRPAITTALAAWLFACCPYAVHWSAELRPYAWLMLLSAGAAWAAFSETHSKPTRLAIFFACVLLGIFTHRFMAFVVVAIGAARLVVRRPTMLHLGWLVAAGTLAVAPSVPWFLSFAGTATQRRLDFQESVGGFRLRRTFVMEALGLPVRLVVPYIGALGGAWAWLARIAALCFGGSVAVAAWSWLRDRERTTSAPLRALAVFSVVYFALVSLAAFWTWDRLPLQYYAPLGWALPVLIAELASRARPALIVALAGFAFALGIAQAGGQGTEDMRRAVEVAREAGAKLERPRYTALLSQPTLFEHVIPYRAYARDLDFIAPEDVAQPGEIGHERPLVAIRRGTISLELDVWKPLLAGRRVVSEEKVDAYLTVFVFERE